MRIGDLLYWMTDYGCVSNALRKPWDDSRSIYPQARSVKKGYDKTCTNWRQWSQACFSDKIKRRPLQQGPPQFTLSDLKPIFCRLFQASLAFQASRLFPFFQSARAFAPFRSFLPSRSSHALRFHFLRRHPSCQSLLFQA